MRHYLVGWSALCFEVGARADYTLAVRAWIESTHAAVMSEGAPVESLKAFERLVARGRIETAARDLEVARDLALARAKFSGVRRPALEVSRPQLPVPPIGAAFNEASVAMRRDQVTCPACATALDAIEERGVKVKTERLSYVFVSDVVMRGPDGLKRALSGRVHLWAGTTPGRKQRDRYVKRHGPMCGEQGEGSWFDRRSFAAKIGEVRRAVGLGWPDAPQPEPIWSRPTPAESEFMRVGFGFDNEHDEPPGCQASRGDGECVWEGCPQLRDGEPERTGRHCPLDSRDTSGDE